MNLDYLIEIITQEFFEEFYADKFRNDWHAMHLVSISTATCYEAIEHFKI